MVSTPSLYRAMRDCRNRVVPCHKTSWFYDKEQYRSQFTREPAHGYPIQAIDRGPIKIVLSKYGNMPSTVWLSLVWVFILEIHILTFSLTLHVVQIFFFPLC